LRLAEFVRDILLGEIGFKTRLFESLDDSPVILAVYGLAHIVSNGTSHYGIIPKWDICLAPLRRHSIFKKPREIEVHGITGITGTSTINSR